MMLLIKMYAHVGTFGEDKDAAAELRKFVLHPEISNGNSVAVDFAGVDIVTQSFIHALVSDILRKEGESALDQLEFKNCNDNIRGIIETVVQYSLDDQ